MKQAGLLISPKRGIFQITNGGRQLLAKKPTKINVALLEQYPAFVEFRNRRKDEVEEQTIKVPSIPPKRLVCRDQVRAAPPAFFERLVIDLLVAMGYGGSRQDAGRAIGRTADEGIDGIIKEDKLGLDAIYVQAKRWEATVGRPEIQKFAGALQGQRATKGVFITTSSFSREAEDFAGNISSKIILIDGERLAELMIDYNVGVAPVGVYELKRIDSDYFEGA